MASNFSLRSSRLSNPKAVLSEDTFYFRANSPNTAKINVKDTQRHGLVQNAVAKQFLLSQTCNIRLSSKWILPAALSSMASAAYSGGSILEDECSLAKSQTKEIDFSCVDCLVWVLHESARSFSLSVRTLEVARTGTPVAMAWTGVDVDAWHKHTAYQVAVYALLKAAIEVELFLSHNRCINPSPVQKILSPITDILGDHVESQLSTRSPQLVRWFRMVELPRLSGLLMPLFKKWSMEYAGSGVAGTIMAIACCAAVEKLGSARISCSLFSNSNQDTLIQLMNMARDQVSVDKLHHLATEAGFEEDFLFHFGSKVLPSKDVEDIEFWIGLVQRKIFASFERESVTRGRHNLSDKVQENSLATLGLFSYLGRESRLFLSRHNIKDLDEQINDFLSYLECGIIVIYPKFSTLSEYQLLTEVIIDEIGWLDFYASYNGHLCQERRRSKHHPTQAEQEILLYAVFTVCYDVIAGFAHYSNSTQQSIDSDLLEFLLHSQSLLSACLEDYWAAYDPVYGRSHDLQRIGERYVPDSVQSILMKGAKNPSFIMDARSRPDVKGEKEKRQPVSSETQATGSSGAQPKTLIDPGNSAASKPLRRNFLKKSAAKLVAASVDVWMGTQLLFVDISNALRLTMKKLYGHKVTKREWKKMQRTISDIATLIPVIILMLLPVSAVGHAAMFAAIKRYMPFLIPSPYSDERLNLVKQLKRTKKMEVKRISTEGATCVV